jgi:hypothetical protein
MVIALACLAVWICGGVVGRAMMRFDFAQAFPCFYDPAEAFEPRNCPAEWRTLNAISGVLACGGPALVVTALCLSTQYGFIWRTPLAVRQMREGA